VAPIESIDTLITGDEADAGQLERLRATGLRIILAGADQAAPRR
jgi:DeoR/GlpR family transcriptional regulator of sugar metabolism